MKQKKINMGELPESDEFACYELKAKYIQKGDTCTTNDLNELEIETQDSGAGIYFILKTERWAFDDLDELIVLIKDFKNKVK